MSNHLTSGFDFPVSEDGLSSKSPPEKKRFPLDGIKGFVHWEWDVSANTVIYSREWRNILLRPDDESVETTVSCWWPYVHEEDVQPFLEAARDIAEGVTEKYQSIFRIQRADGAWAWLLSRGRVVEKCGERPKRVCGVLMDITFLRSDIKFQHGSAGMSAPRFHALSEKAVNASVEESVASAPQRINCKSVRYLFPADAELCSEAGAGFFEEMAPDLRSHMQDCVRKVFEQGGALREVVTFATDYGQIVTGEYLFWPKLDAEGRVTAVMTQFWDLTDSLLAKRRAKLNEMRLEALYRLTQMSGVPEDEVMDFVMDRMVRLTESSRGFLFFPHAGSNRKGRVVWSKNYEQVLDKGLLSDDTLPEELVDITLAENGKIHRAVIRNGNCLQPVMLAHEGRLRVMRYIAAPVYDGEQLVCVAGVCNKENMEYRNSDLQQHEAFINGAWLMLRRHEYIRELQRAKDAAEKANKVKDAFLANVSHELRTPLNGMLSMLQLLDFLPLDEENREYVRTADSSGKALLRIISDILDFSHMESGKMALRVEPFDFKSTLVSALSLFRREAEERGLIFEAFADEDIPQALLGDDARVRQIIFNTVGNALKFTEKGGIYVECSTLPHEDDAYVWLYLTIRDTGIGIPHEEQVRIFEAFTQIDSASTRKYQGTGLGLSIVRHLVDLMGGGVSVESEPGKGTIVHCSLRFARVPGKTRPFEARVAPRNGPGADVLRILVVEDDDVSRLAIYKFLQHLGHTPVCVRNGYLALEMLQLYTFDCLFTDIQMPGMDGLEVVRRVREGRLDDIVPTEEAGELLRAEIPGSYGKIFPVSGDLIAVAVSAHTMQGDKERFLEEGMDFFIAKPIIMKELEGVLLGISARLGKARL
jgi:signal transduction histidine kinase